MGNISGQRCGGEKKCEKRKPGGKRRNSETGKGKSEGRKKEDFQGETPHYKGGGKKVNLRIEVEKN